MSIPARIAVAFAAFLLIPSVIALDFTEDFEDDTANADPTSTFYTYQENNDIGFVTATAPLIGGAQSMKLEGTDTTTGNFAMSAPSQLTDLTFTVRPITIDDDGVGSNQVIRIDSGAPTRTLVEFFVICTDAANPTGCDFRVRFDQVDTTGQVLINSTVGDHEFTVQIIPDWTSGSYQLLVDAVDDGDFPMLELPQNIGRIQFQKHGTTAPLNMVFDDWSIEGADEAPAGASGDFSTELLDLMRELDFTSTTSQFIFGIILFITVILAIALTLFHLGNDNTLAGIIVFPASLCLFWLVNMEVWPDWMGIALIIIVSALIGTFIRTGLMGIRDASTDAGIVAGTLGYFIITTTLLGFSGFATTDIELPTGDLSTPEDQNETAEDQTFAVATIECLGNIITFGLFDMDCSQQTTGETFKKIQDLASTVFNFARVAFRFLFQLLSFQLPIPTVFNVIIVMPPAAALAMVGFKAVTNRGG